MRNIAIAMAVAMLLGSPGQAQSVQAGIQAWQNGLHQKAVDIWRPLAEAGNADAQFNLGQAYRLGRGVPVNLAAAQTWLGRAAAKGHVDAQTTIGLLLFDSGNRADGLRWLRAAAEKGEPRAMLIYGTALFNGEEIERDPVLAYAYVSRSAAQGLAAAKATLADMDKVMPLAQRKQGVKLGMAKATSGGKKTGTAAVPARANPPQPTAKTATPPPSSAAAPAAGGWRIQLGAFSQSGSAEALFRKVSAAPALAGCRPFYIRSGAVTRLQVGPFASRAAATQACAALRGQACFAVAAK